MRLCGKFVARVLIKYVYKRGYDMKKELLKGLTEDQIAKVKACGSNEEIFELAKKEGITLTDEQLEVVSSGGFLLFNTLKKIELTIKLVNVNKIIVIGPSGAGKSEMSRKLHDILDLPL